MKNYIFGLVAAWMVMCPTQAESQRVKRVGGLMANDQFIPAIEGFKKRMTELGYIEGKNIRYDFNNAQGQSDEIRTQAEKLVKDKPDLIVAASAAAATALMQATKDNGIPVVFLSVADPSNFERSYGGSLNNFTGISASTIDLTEKRMELLKELVPNIKRAIAVHNSRGLNYEANLHATRTAAKRLAMDLTEVTVATSEELIRRGPVVIVRKAGEAIIYPPDRIVKTIQTTMFPHLLKERLPSIAASIDSVRAGAVATYAADYFAIGEQGAMLGDNILRGANPSELPVQIPFKLRLVLNMRTARAIGLKVPKELFVRADEVIE